MLAFIDESGYPHPNDPSSRPTLLAVCFREREMRQVSKQVYQIKESLNLSQNMELKANKLLNRHTFRRSREKWELLESIFSYIKKLDVKVFVIVMHKMNEYRPEDPKKLSWSYQQLLIRINHYAQELDEMGLVVYDQRDTKADRQISDAFNNYLFRSSTGKSLRNIVESPLFVSSFITPGIQFADLCAGVVRQYQENKLYEQVPVGDAYAGALVRFYGIIRSKTFDYETENGYIDYGMLFAPEDNQIIKETAATELRIN